MMIDIVPYVGAGALRFGMPEREIASILPEPLRKGKNRRKELTYHFSEFSLVFSQDSLVEITYYPQADLQLFGVDLFRDPESLKKLAEFDPSLLEYVGILYFPSLGITLSGFQNGEPKTVTAVARERLSHVASKFQPYRIGQQNNRGHNRDTGSVLT